MSCFSFIWYRARFGRRDFRVRSDPQAWRLPEHRGRWQDWGGFSSDVGCDICGLRLQDCSDLLNPQDQWFDGTDTSFRLDGLGGVHEFLRYFSVQVVT